MNRRGHFITGAASAIASYFIFKSPVMSAGIFLASQAPDTLECSYRDPSGYKGYSRLINHRTITHWPPVWVALFFLAPLIAAYMPNVPMIEKILGSVNLGNLPKTTELLIMGYAAGCGVHLFFDIFSKSGIPIFLPFAKNRKKIPIYHTGKNEWRLWLPYCAILLFIGFSSEYKNYIA